METEKIYTQHEENKEWMNKVLFYWDDLKIMTNRLEEIRSKNTSKDILAQVEHFQNQFMIQTKHMEDIRNEIKMSDRLINREINKNEVAVDHRSMGDHTSLRESVVTFEKLFTQLRIEFIAFLSKWM